MSLEEMIQDVINSGAWCDSGYRPDRKEFWAIISEPGQPDAYWGFGKTPEIAFRDAYQKFTGT